MYTVGTGDDASEWAVEDISFRANNAVDKAAWFDVSNSHLYHYPLALFCNSI
jgi:hypothetical protein